MFYYIILTEKKHFNNKHSIINIIMKKLMFLLIFGASSIAFAEVNSFAWDSSLITTNTAAGTGYDFWTSPEPIDSNGIDYYFTSRRHTVAYPLGLGTPEDAGILESSTNIGYPASLPFVLGNDIVSGVISGSMTVTYSFRVKSIIETNWNIKLELSEFESSPINARLEMIGNLSENNGSYVHVVIPEPFLLINFYLLFIIYYFKKRT